MARLLNESASVGPPCRHLFGGCGGPNQKQTKENLLAEWLIRLLLDISENTRGSQDSEDAFMDRIEGVLAAQDDSLAIR